ncbi:hypothetical protein HPB49_001800 [Dermacentor silvarum]|uniref:Uncharacterized protein n=1 Tax=Dermacentor silvarum TaxID=543639 RepID=A0ACB8CNW3_DERSI|nr:hypothetical protein HPB49_001800 [Dermacentor silvarum]
MDVNVLASFARRQAPCSAVKDSTSSCVEPDCGYPRAVTMSVHYKFKSSLDFDTVTFDGLHISVGELKKNILQQKKIGKAADFDLQITNAQTKEVYTSDDYLIPKNTSVIVARVPVTTTGRKNW